MFIAALVKMLPAPRAAVTDDDAGYYDQLIHSIFKAGNSSAEKASVIAFASASKEAGTSFVAREVGMELARYGKERTAIIDARRLQSISISDLEKWARLCSITESGTSWLKHEVEISVNEKPGMKKQASLWQRDVAFRQSCLQLLRKYFNHVLIDCPSTNSSISLTLIAELVDGVVVVAAAGQTR
ncbi:MAG: hypothetical protein ABI977_15415 [Acidobacteriota bacterium]